MGDARDYRPSGLQDAGAWEPMMLVASLAAAAALVFLIYGDRMPLDAKASLAQTAAPAAAVVSGRSLPPRS